MARWRRKGWYADVLRREFDNNAARAQSETAAQIIREVKAIDVPVQGNPNNYAVLEVPDGEFPFDEPKQLTFPFPTEGGS